MRNLIYGRQSANFEWLENTQLIEKQPYIQVAAVFTGMPHQDTGAVL